MAIAYDATSSTTGGYTSTLSVSHTCTGSDRILVVSVYSFGDGVAPDAVTSLTYNGVALTKIRSDVNTNMGTELWYLVAPATGANTIALTYASTNNGHSGMRGISFTGVSQSTPIDVNGGNTAGTTSVSQSVTTTADNCMLVDAFVKYNTTETPSPDSGQTGNTDSHGSGWGLYGGQSRKAAASAGSHSMGWSWSTTSRDSTISIAALNEASSPISVTPTTASLTMTPNAPTVTVSDHKTATPTTTSLTLTGNAPTVTASNHQSVTPTTASLSSTTYEPTISVSDNQTATPTTASLSLVTYEPTVALSDNQSVTPSTLALSLTGNAPTVATTNNISVEPTTASLTLTGNAPTVTTSTDVVTPSPASLTLTTYAPTVSYSVTARKYYIDPSGNVYWVINQQLGLVEKV